MKRHHSLTSAVLCEAVQRNAFGLGNSGFCLVCGLEHEGVEPDARNYECEACQAMYVYGAEEILLSLPMEAA